MKIDGVSLSNFRNFKKKSFKFASSTTVIVGPNASGKTNIMEAIYLLSSGKSFRARVEEEMISYGAEITRVNGRANKTKLEVVLTRGEITVGEDPEKTQKVPKKKLLVNGVSRRLFNFAGNFSVVLFGPKDLDLVTESPSLRRNFLDSVLSLTDNEYLRAVLSYEKGLRQRNKLLWRIREEGLSRSQLLFWDRLLIKNGDYITKRRNDLIEYINTKESVDGERFSLSYDSSPISEARIEQYAKEEVAASTTLVGPHRDDFCFELRKKKNGKQKRRDLSKFGSRGEQRMGVLWLKLAELSFVETETEQKPALLLDDIFSELDHDHRDVVMQVVGDQQTIITTAEEHFVEDIKGVEKINLKG